MMPPYKDLTDKAEDDRIKEIGEHVMKQKLTVGFFIDREEDKIERYIKKLMERFPGVRLISKTVIGEHLTLVKIGPPLN